MINSGFYCIITKSPSLDSGNLEILCSKMKNFFPDRFKDISSSEFEISSEV